MSAGQSVSLDQTTLFFPPPLERSIENILTVTSTASQPITFKMKTSAPNYYAVKKRTGFIAPGGSEKISITFRCPQPGQPGYTAVERSKDKFQLEVRYLAEDGSEQAAYRAIGTSGQPGDGNLAQAISDLRASSRSPAVELQDGSKDQDVLSAMWKAKGAGYSAAKDGLKVISCRFDGVPEGMQVKARPPPAAVPATTTAAAPMQAVNPPPATNTGELERLRGEKRSLEAEKAQLQNKKGGGLPIGAVVAIVLVALVGGRLVMGGMGGGAAEEKEGGEL